MLSRDPIRVLICNRFTLFREGLKALLRQGVPMLIVAETDTATEAVRMIERFHPDVVLLDATMPDLSSCESTRHMKSIDPGVKIVIVSMNDDEPLRAGCLEAGASVCMGNEDHAWDLKETINRTCKPRARSIYAKWSFA